MNNQSISFGKLFPAAGLCVAGLMALGSPLGCEANGGRDAFGGGGIAGPGQDGASVDGDVDDADDDDPDASDDPAADEPQSELPFDPEMLANVCARQNGDRVAAAICSGQPLHSVGELRAALGFEDPFFAMTGNSSSLVARNVNALNPRLIVAEKNFAGSDGGQDVLERTMAMGFVRGEQLVELMAYDPKSDDLNFYLLKFEQACNSSPDGCTTADLVTPAVEQNWTRWTVYQDVDLENTTVDCLACHQPLGPNTPKIPRIQEVNNSWTHWFPVRPATPPDPFNGGGGGGPWSTGETQTDGVQVDNSNEHGTRTSELLWDMFERMHAIDGEYGSVPIDQLHDAAAGPDMETFVRTYLDQRELPLMMQAPEDPDAAMTNDFFCDSPSMEELGSASQWSAEYARVLSGERLPLPSFRIDITDEFKREAAIDSYLDLMEGFATPLTLIDPRSVIDDEVMREMSVLPRKDASAEEILTHMCGRCHNGNLDPDATRARFDATNLAAVSDAEKAVIVSRLTMHEDDRRLMPPKRFGTLPEWAVERVLTWAQP